MCTKNTLYRPADIPLTALEKKKRGKGMTFAQVSRMTDYLRKVASRRDMPIVNVVSEIRERSLFPAIYSIVENKQELTERQIVNQIHRLMVK